MSVFTGKPANPAMQTLGTEVGKNVMATCLAAMDVAREHFTDEPSDVSFAVAQGVIAGLINFAHYGNVPAEQVRELIVGATDDMLRQFAEHEACGGHPMGRA